MALPTFLIVGAKKCGTTALAQASAAHPQGVRAGAQGGALLRLRGALAPWRGVVRGRLRGRRGGRGVGDATPEYMGDGRAIERMARVLPHVRLLVCARNRQWR